MLLESSIMLLDNITVQSSLMMIANDDCNMFIVQATVVDVKKLIFVTNAVLK
jgi:hypothetical protein